MTDFQNMVLMGGLVLFILVAVGAWVFLLRDLRFRSNGPTHSATDLTNMMIMFQTMRDVLAQQKDLAREFNLSIDKKVGEVRDLIQSTGDVRNDLERAKREIAVLATQTRRELSALERRLTQVDGQVQEAGGDGIGLADALDDAAMEVAEAAEDDPEPVGDSGGAVQDAADADLIEGWAGADFGAGEDDESELDNGPELNAVEAAEDATQTREAFRDLLNFHTEGREDTAPTSSEVLNSSGNGGQYLSPIQQRVYEYSDAGMRVPEIARELGVGKGEVRLILSLRNDRGQRASG